MESNVFSEGLIYGLSEYIKAKLEILCRLAEILVQK